jgi:serine/alanine adding enzyme
LEILRNNEIPIEKWNNFIARSPYSSIFQTPAFYSLSNSVSGLSADAFAIREDSEIVALFVVTYYRIPGIIGFFSRRAIITGDPILKGEDNEKLEFLLASIINETKHKAIYIEIRNISNLNCFSQVFKKHGFDFVDHLNIFIDLNKTDKELWEAIHKNRKKEIKNGYNKGLNVRLISLNETTYLPNIFSLLERLYNEIGFPLPSIDFFSSAVQILEKNGSLKTFCAFLENKIIGFRMVLTYNKSIYDWYAASDKKFLEYRPNDILPWEIIKWGKRNNYKIFDFGGAGRPGIPYGVRDYKLKFGGELVNYGRYLKINQPFLFVIGKIGFKIFRKFK